MRLFPQDNEVELYETGFENDILDRSSLSKQLSDLVERIEDPMVLALDDKWGTGKTYFLKRWVAEHCKVNDKAVTVYFDAFANDYLSDPLISLISEVSSRTPNEKSELIVRLKTAASKLVKPTFGVALSLATFGAKAHLDEIGDVVADAVSGEISEASKHLWAVERERKDAMASFKDLLSEVTEDGSRSIIIVVDELDRCRPDYALSVLEVIKHFFSVPHVHFILGVNGFALQNSVKARYGADIDAEVYLRKFISVTFSLPKYIGDQGEVSALQKFGSKTILEMELPEKIAKRCLELLVIVSRHNEVSLRDVGMVLSKVALVPAEVSEKNIRKGWIDTLCALLVVSVVEPKLHQNLIGFGASVEELRHFLGATVEKTSEIIGDDYNRDYDHQLAYWLVSLLFVCGVDELSEIDNLPQWKEEIAKDFSDLGVRDRRSIARTIQRDWVELFKV